MAFCQSRQKKRQFEPNSTQKCTVWLFFCNTQRGMTLWK
nr:MAG TPA: hypothetical protein [Caudoviricetes sp.]